ncbi:MAG: cysteine desulfurase [Saprospiraceae bacterium]|nr:cysteine desulfurase [Saprospiraceae bacterium]
MKVYLDNAATTPLNEEVIEEMLKIMREGFGNPSSIHSDGRKTRAALEDARKRVAKRINASIGEIFFTSGGTESNNMAIKCAVRDLGVQRIITSPVEHHCVLHTVERMDSEGVQVDLVPIDGFGRPNYDALASMLADSNVKTLVSLMHANNEIGTVLDLKRVSMLCSEYGAFLHSDTVQTVGHLPIDVSQMTIHFLSGSGHKFHGPKGAGFIYINGDAQIKPFIDGGAQERNMRAGTENVYGIVGLAKALDMACDQLEERRNKIEDVRQYFKENLTSRFVDIRFEGDHDGDYLYTVLNVSFPANDKSELLLFNLDISGVSASGGSACSSGADAGSHVIKAIRQGSDRVNVRFSFSHYNTREEVDFVLEKLASILDQKPVATWSE